MRRSRWTLDKYLKPKTPNSTNTQAQPNNNSKDTTEDMSMEKNEMDSSSDDSSASYTLHAVLVHSGDNNGGHYVVFVVSYTQ